jgi:hypothetical protein
MLLRLAVEASEYAASRPYHVDPLPLPFCAWKAAVARNGLISAEGAYQIIDDLKLSVPTVVGSGAFGPT